MRLLVLLLSMMLVWAQAVGAQPEVRLSDTGPAVSIVSVMPIKWGGTGNGSLGVSAVGIYAGDGTKIVQKTGTALQYCRVNAAGTAIEFAAFPSIPSTPISIANGGTNNASLGVSAIALVTGDGSKLVQTATGGVLQSIRVNAAGTALEWYTPTVYAATGANSDITSLAGLTTPLSTGQGGTGNASLGVSALGIYAGDGTKITQVTGTAGQSWRVNAGGAAVEAYTPTVYAATGANSDITSLSGLTTPLSAAQGGTGLATSGVDATKYLKSDGAGGFTMSTPSSGGGGFGGDGSDGAVNLSGTFTYPDQINATDLVVTGVTTIQHDAQYFVINATGTVTWNAAGYLYGVPGATGGTATTGHSLVYATGVSGGENGGVVANVGAGGGGGGSAESWGGVGGNVGESGLQAAGGRRCGVIPGAIGGGGGAGGGDNTNAGGNGGAGNACLAICAKGAITVPNQATTIYFFGGNGSPGTGGNAGGGGGGACGTILLASQTSVVNSATGSSFSNWGGAGGAGAGTGGGGGGGCGGFVFIWAPIRTPGAVDVHGGAAGAGGSPAAGVGGTGYVLEIAGTPNLPLVVWFMKEGGDAQLIAEAKRRDTENTHHVCFSQLEVAYIAAAGDPIKTLAYFRGDEEKLAEIASAEKLGKVLAFRLPNRKAA